MDIFSSKKWIIYGQSMDIFHTFFQSISQNTQSIAFFAQTARTARFRKFPKSVHWTRFRVSALGLFLAKTESLRYANFVYSAGLPIFAFARYVTQTKSSRDSFSLFHQHFTDIRTLHVFGFMSSNRCFQRQVCSQPVQSALTRFTAQTIHWMVCLFH